MRSLLRRAIGRTACAAALALSAPAIGADKIANFGEGSLAASETQFIEAALIEPASGRCEALSPDPRFVEEMLVRFGEDGTKSHERRVALVVGNGAYREPISPLTNPPNDAAAMAKMLRALGFTVYRAVDASRTALDDCFGKFKGDLEKGDAGGKKADIALFFYAGHGVQLSSDNEKRNYMLSVDASVDAATGKARGFKPIDSVLTEMREHSRQAVFLYDACRNAPYGEGVKEADGRAVRAYDASDGAAPIDADESARASGAGLFIAYATSPGKTADDGWGPQGSEHSPFTEALLNNLPQPGATIDEALARAFNSVGELTEWRQTPWTSSSLTTKLQLNGAYAKREVAARSAELAALAAEARADDFRGEAFVSALKGQTRVWHDGPAAVPFAPARAELYRAYQDKDAAVVRHDVLGITQTAFSPDGAGLIAQSIDAVRVFDAGFGRLVRESQCCSNAPILALSPDGGFALSRAREAPHEGLLWNVETGAVVGRIANIEDQFGQAMLSANGKRVLLYSEGSYSVFEFASGRRLAAVKGKGEPSLSPDGSRIALIGKEEGNHTAFVYDAETGAIVRTLINPGDFITATAFSSDGAQIATGSADGAVRIWNLADSEIGRRLERGAGGWITALAVSADGRRIAAGKLDGATHVLDTQSGEVVAVRESRGVEVRKVAFAPDGVRLVTQTQNIAYIWRAEERALLANEYLYDLAFDAKRLVGSAGRGAPGALKMWDRASRAMTTLAGHKAPIYGVRIFPKGDRALTWSGDDGGVKVWNLASGAETLSLEVFGVDGKYLGEAGVSPDGRRIFTVEFNRLRLWDSVSGAEQLGILGYFGGAAFAPGGKEILTSGREVGRFDAETGFKLGSYPFASSKIAFSPTRDRFVSLDGAQPPELRDAATGELVLTFRGHMQAVRDAEFSSDGRRLLTDSRDRTARLWDAHTGALLRIFRAQEAAIAPDDMIALAVDEGIEIIDAGVYGQKLLDAAYAALPKDLKAEVDRDRIRYWEVDPQLLQ